MKIIFLIILLGSISLQLAAAVCPACTIAVATGVGLLRGFGIDDLISGLWLGALIISSILWFISWLDKKNIKFLFRKITIIVVFYLVFILPLYYMKTIGIPGNVLLGIDKLLFGVIIGSIIFILAVLSDKYLRNINEDKVVVPYQKVFIPIIYLIISSLIVYFLLKIMV